MAKLQVLLQAFTLLFSLLASNVVARSGSGIATFFTDQTRLACPGAVGHRKGAIAAVSNKLWEHGDACGKTLTVQCTGAVGGGRNPCRGNGRLTAKIEDFCDDCRGLIDLTEKEFAEIADETAGEIEVSFNLS